MVKIFVGDSGLNVECIETSKAIEAIELLSKREQDFSFIICECDEWQEQAFELVDYWHNHLPYIPLILSGSSKGLLKSKYQQIYGDLGSRIEFVDKGSGVDSFQLALLDLWRKGFCPVPIHFFGSELPLKADVYVNVSHSKLIKVFNKEETLDLSRVSEYRSKGLTQFFISNPDYQKHLCTSFSYPIFDLGSQVGSYKEVFCRFINSYGTVLKKRFLRGDSIDSCLNTLGSGLKEAIEGDSFSFIKKIELNKREYVLNHSFMIIALADLILRDLGLSSKRIRKSVFEAVIIHDILFEDELAWKRDLYLESLNKKEAEKAFFVDQLIIQKADKAKLSSDSLIIFESLKSSYYDRKSLQTGTYRIADIVVKVHLLTNDLFRGEFSRPLDSSRMEEIFGGSKEVLQATKEVFHF